MWLGGILAVLAVFIPMSGASAATTALNGDWAPFNRCPVENSAMLAADGTSAIAYCLASDSPSGVMHLGGVTVNTGDVNLQVGLVADSTTGNFSVVSPSGGAITADPVTVPGGLLGLMCPSDIPVVSAVCAEITNSSLNTVTAVVQSAGDPSAFSLAAGTSSGEPIITVPVKIQLENPLLGSSCYIGTNSSPILLSPENVTAPTVSADNFDGNGTPDSAGAMFELASLGASQGDDSAAVPGATGCGLLGILNGAVDSKVGIPSPAGSNSITLNDASAYLAGLASPSAAAPSDGQELAQYWNSALSS
jgi:hypothetical protein